jgi:hypothetical protein
LKVIISQYVSQSIQVIFKEDASSYFLLFRSWQKRFERHVSKQKSSIIKSLQQQSHLNKPLIMKQTVIYQS